MAVPTQAEILVERGWRRRLLVLCVDQSALALAAVFAGFALLILLGTQILAWPWLFTIAAIGIAFTVIGVRRRLAGRYSVAQMIDRRLALHDALSTAWFLRSSNASENSAAAAFQLHYAEQLAQTADPAAAFPFQAQRLWIVTGLLCLLALGLFSARYLVTRDLSLQHAFLPLAFTQAIERVAHAASDKDGGKRQTARTEKLPTLPPAPSEQALERRQSPPKPEQSADLKQSLQSHSGAADGKGGESAAQNQDQAKENGGEGADAKRADSGNAQKGSDTPNGKQTPDGNNPQDSKQQEANGTQRSENLMDRMRDAVSSVMAKIKPSGSPDSQQGSQKSSEGKKSSEQAASKDQSGNDSQKESEKEQSATEQASGQQQGQGAAKAQASGKDSARASDKNGSDAQSGVGHSDGDKEIKAAEQAKAMGKLAEIIGKRSAALTGDMRVEPSGKQQLQTAYTNRQAQHADLGGAIDRDEVAVEDQEYVREYMELVRKESARKRAQKGTTSH